MKLEGLVVNYFILLYFYLHHVGNQSLKENKLETYEFQMEEFREEMKRLSNKKSK